MFYIILLFINFFLTIIFFKKVYSSSIIFFLPVLLWVLTEFVVLQLSPFILFFIFKLSINNIILHYRSFFYLIFILSNFLIYNIFKNKFSNNNLLLNFYDNNIFHLFIFWISIFILFFYILLDGISARELYGNDINSTNSFYYIRGLFDILYFLTFILGFKRDKISFLFFFLFCFIMILGEHRGQLFSFVIVFLFGILINNKFNKIYYKFTFKFILFFIFLVYTFISITQRRLNTSRQFQKNAIIMSFDRFYEPTIDRIINYSLIKSNNFFYFENFDRILTMPIPSFLLKNKKNNDDSNENLNKYYNYDTSKVHWPIPFLADSYRRFSFFGVFIFSFIFLYFLQYLYLYFLFKSYNHILISAFIVSFSFRLYSFSLLGLIAFFIYMIPKMYFFTLFNKKIKT